MSLEDERGKQTAQAAALLLSALSLILPAKALSYISSSFSSSCDQAEGMQANVSGGLHLPCFLSVKGTLQER
jgi:hypothetical protein